MNIYWLIYGVLIIAGGVMGFVKAKSKASLIAGGVSGVLILLSGYWMAQGVKAGIIMGHLVSLALLVKFGITYLKTKKPFPSIMIIVLALGGIVHTIILAMK